MAKGESLLVEEVLIEWSLASAASEEAIPTLMMGDQGTKMKRGRSQLGEKKEEGSEGARELDGSKGSISTSR